MPDLRSILATFDREDLRVAVGFALVALVLYLPGLGWGVPYATTPDRTLAWGSDELAPLGSVAELYRVFLDPSPQFNPQYPLFHYVVQALFVAPYLAWLRITGGLAGASSVYPYGLTDPVHGLAVTTVLSRLPSTLMAAGVVVCAWAAGKALWGSRAGRVAGVFALLMYPMFYYSRTSNVDVPALFWSAAGLAVFARCLRHGLTRRRAVALGVLAALATGTKDASFFVFLGMTPALVPWNLVRERRGWAEWKRPLTDIAWGAGVSAVTYAVASGFVFDPGRFFFHVEFISHSTAFLLYPVSLLGYLGLIRETTAHGLASLGVPLALLAAAGLVMAVRRDRSVLWFALPGVGVIAGTILPVHFVNFRYVLIPAFIALFFAAYAVDQWLNDPGRRRLGQVAWVIAAGWALVRGGDLTYQMLRDSRDTAAAWLADRVGDGDRLGFYGAVQKLPHIPAALDAMNVSDLCSPEDWASDRAPSFVAVIPQQHFEIEREWELAPAVYRGLQDGSLGYVLAFHYRSPSLSPRRIVPFVNPPVRIYVREDRWRELGVAPVRSTGTLLGGVEAAVGLVPRVPPGLARNYDRAPDPCTSAAEASTIPAEKTRDSTFAATGAAFHPGSA